jgi:hypothetical protein
VTYVSLIGKNTLSIGVLHHVVWTISLIAGRHPDLCN